MQGLGNDFLVFDAAARGRYPPGPSKLRALADRHTGVGFDQALMLENPRDAASRVFYRMFNSDGTRSRTMRQRRALYRRAACTARAPQLGRELSMESARRNRSCPRQGRRHGVGGHGRSRISIRAPLPMEVGRRGAMTYSLERRRRGGRVRRRLHGQSACGAARGRRENTRRSSGLGLVSSVTRAFRSAPMWASCRSWIAATCKLRVFERGVGETLACGTGACAAVAVGRRLGIAGGGSAGRFAWRYGAG